MTVSVASFRTDVPECADVTQYPNNVITYWLGIAALMLTSPRWGVGSLAPATPPTTLLDFGTEMFVAHNAIIERQAMQTAAAGGTPGQVQGPISSKSVGPAAISYDTGAVIDEGATHWNLTVYGLRFIKLAKQIGMGPIQVGGVNCQPPFSGPAWPGPLPFGWGIGS